MFTLCKSLCVSNVGSPYGLLWERHIFFRFIWSDVVGLVAISGWSSIYRYFGAYFKSNFKNIIEKKIVVLALIIIMLQQKNAFKTKENFICITKCHGALYSFTTGQIWILMVQSHFPDIMNKICIQKPQQFRSVCRARISCERFVNHYPGTQWARVYLSSKIAY